jgi:hypothetical protein
VQGVGWVPADVSGGMNSELLGVLGRINGGPYPYGFGRDDGNFLVLYVGTAFTVEALNDGLQSAELQSIAYWASGQGTFDDRVSNQNWDVHLGPIPGPTSGPTTRPRGNSQKANSH